MVEAVANSCVFSYAVVGADVGIGPYRALHKSVAAHWTAQNPAPTSPDLELTRKNAPLAQRGVVF